MANSVVNQVKVGSTTYDMKPYLGSATSGDSTTATSWTAVSNAIANTDSYDTVFNKVTSMVRNVRYLYNKLGTTDFSAVGSTTSAALVALNNGKSSTDHTHSNYATTGHTHSNYSLTTHTHSNYSTTGHTHNYAASNHNHDTAYAAKSHSHSGYSTTGHTHSNYSTTGHTHSNYSTTGHTHSYIATNAIVTTQTNNSSKVPAASLVYSMNQTLSSLNDAFNYSHYTDSSFWTNTGCSVKVSSISGSVVIYGVEKTMNLTSTVTLTVSTTYSYTPSSDVKFGPTDGYYCLPILIGKYASNVNGRWTQLSSTLSVSSSHGGGIWLYESSSNVMIGSKLSTSAATTGNAVKITSKTNATITIPSFVVSYK